MWLTLVMAALLAAAGAVHAEDATRPEGHAALDPLVGTWTIEGRESTYRETCAWYHGQHHVVCNAEFTRKDGSNSHSMSILAYVPGQGYVYTGIGAEGRYETYRGGTFTDGVLEYRDVADGQHVRIRVGPFTDRKIVPFRVHVSKDGQTWEAADTFNYTRIE